MTTSIIITPSKMKSILTQLNTSIKKVKESEVLVTEVTADCISFVVNNEQWYVELTKTGRVKRNSLDYPRYRLNR